MNLSSVIPGGNSSGLQIANWFASYKLGFLTGTEGDFNITLKSHFRGVVITNFFFSSSLYWCYRLKKKNSLFEQQLIDPIYKWRLS